MCIWQEWSPWKKHPTQNLKLVWQISSGTIKRRWHRLNLPVTPHRPRESLLLFASSNLVNVSGCRLLFKRPHIIRRCQECHIKETPMASKRTQCPRIWWRSINILRRRRVKRAFFYLKIFQWNQIDHNCLVKKALAGTQLTTQIHIYDNVPIEQLFTLSCVSIINSDYSRRASFKLLLFSNLMLN